VTSWPDWAGTALLASALSVGLCGALRGSEENAEATPGEAGEVPWRWPPPDTPIADSVDPTVAKLIRERFSPCDASNDVPCFPVTVEVKGHRYSVRETLEHLELDSRPAPGPPSAAEMIQYGANPHPTSAGVGVDPKSIVCKTRQLLRGIRGESRTYYLYRLWDRTGERAVLRDRPLDPEALMPSPQVRYEPLGEFQDECEAIEAYRTTTHEVRMHREAEEAKRGNRPAPELRSDTPPE
jgi:hypothetical protein